MVHIIDKNPRKPRIESPKAQEAYLDDIMTMWVDNHATKDKIETVPKEVPENVRLRYEEKERITKAIMEEKGMFGRPTPIVILDDGTTIERTKIIAARRGETLCKIAAIEEQMYGRARESTLTEIKLCKQFLDGEITERDLLAYWEPY